MPPSNPADDAFLERRRVRARTPLVPFVLLGVIAAVWVGLFAWAPMLVNPKHVLGQIEQHALEAGTLTMYAVIATLLANAVLLLLCAVIAVTLIAGGQERRYLRIVERLLAERAQRAATTSHDIRA